MEQLHIEVSKIINATLPTVYAILADYNKGHQRILPRRYFKKMTVLEGGRGGGTRVRVDMSVFGSKSTMNFLVSEPEPGRVLVETDSTAGVITRFTLEPTGERQTQVTITSSMVISQGLRGSLARFFNKRLIRGIYNQELKMLESYAGALTTTRKAGDVVIKSVSN